MTRTKKISVIIPCRNEESGLAKVLTGFPLAKLAKYGYAVYPIVIDNCSVDGTRKIARKYGAMVVDAPCPGKGNALKAGFAAVPRDSEYVVMMDGDGTYLPSEIIRMVEPLDSGFCSVVVGSRLGGKMKQSSFRFGNRLFNWAITFLVRQYYLANTTDVLSGYFAWKRSVIDVIAPYLTSGGFGIEMEMITKMRKLGFDIYSVPITYDRREGTSKISALRDASVILSTYVRNFFWTPDPVLKRKIRPIVLAEL